MTRPIDHGRAKQTRRIYDEPPLRYSQERAAALKRKQQRMKRETLRRLGLRP